MTNWLHVLAVAATLAAVSPSALASRPPPPWVRPLIGIETYAFRAEITSTVLNEGTWSSVTNSIPASWEGGLVTGTFSFNYDQAEGGPGGPGQVAWGDGNPEYDRHGNWLNISLRNPDGSTLSIPGTTGVPPGSPGNEGRLVADDGYNIFGDNHGGKLEIDRTFADPSSGLSQQFRIELASLVDGGITPVFYENGGLNLVNGMEIDPSRADFTHFGFVSHTGPDGTGFQYAFRLLVVNHMAPVPEPATVAMLATGVALLGWQRRRRGAPGP